MVYKAGIIGTGGIAGMGILGMHNAEDIGNKKVRASHAGGYSESDDIELVAAADLDADTLHTFGDAWDIPDERRYKSHEKMLRTEDLDVVSVCTPTLHHHDHVIDAVEIGDPDVVWCEKPIASSVSEAEEMCTACRDAGIDLVINHSFRFCDKIQTLRSLVDDENIIGDVQSVSAQYRMELMRNSTHVLDTLVYLLDVEPAAVHGYINGQNEAVEALETDVQVSDAGGGGQVVMEDGTFASIDCTVPREHSSMTFNIIGDRGKLYLNNDDGDWRYWRLEDGDHYETDLPGIEGSWTWEDDYESAFPRAAQHTADLVKNGTRNLSPGTDATLSLAVIVGFYLSHHTHGTVSLPLDESMRDVSITSW
jgi:predicted dehydrogenase